MEYRSLSDYHKSLKRSLNRRLNDLEYRQGKTRLRSHPSFLFIDPTNLCNLACPMCPTGQGLMPSRGMLVFADFVSMFEQFKDHVCEVHLYNWGEPLLNPDIFRIVAHIAREKIRTIIHSNLNVPLDRGRAEDLVHSGLSKLVVSMDGLCQETYEKYRRKGSLDRLLSNVRLLVETKRRLHSKLPYLEISCIAFGHNEHELGSLGEEGRLLGVDHCTVVPAILDMQYLTTAKVEQTLAVRGGWLPSKPEYRRYDDTNWISQPKTCHFLWDSAVLRWDGELFPCCVVYRDEDSFGNILRQPFWQIWNDDNYRKARALFGKRVARKNRSPCCCTRCYGFQGYRVT